MGLLDSLFGQHAQVGNTFAAPNGQTLVGTGQYSPTADGTGMAQIYNPQKQSALQQLFSPEVAMPMAAALLGGQGDAKNFGNALGAYGQAKAQTSAQNRTLDFFNKNAPEYAQMVQAGMPVEEAWKTYTQQKYAQKSQGLINAGGGNLYDSVNGKWLSAPGGGAEGIAGLQPVWLQDEKGQPVLGQMTKDGKVIRSQIDNGLTPVGPYQKSFETNRGGAEGKVVGDAAGALPGVTQMAAKINDEVEGLKNDSSLPNVLGPWDSRTPAILPGTVRAQSKIDAIKGGAFLQARQMLKGGGAITDYEGQKAEAAFARLNQAQSEEDFKAALDEFNLYVQQGLTKLQQQAGQHRMGGGYPQQQPPPGGGGGNAPDPLGIR